jgi:hypothetical protein
LIRIWGYWNDGMMEIGRLNGNPGIMECWILDIGYWILDIGNWKLDIGN